MQLCSLLCLQGSRSEDCNIFNLNTYFHYLDEFNIADISVMNNIIDAHTFNPRSPDML